MLVSTQSVHVGAQDPPSPSGSVHRPPSTQLVDRIEFIVSHAAGKSVVDLGFVDESRMAAKQALGSWLHAKVAQVALSTVGIDNEPEGVQLARELGYQAHAADCEDREGLVALGLEPADRGPGAPGHCRRTPRAPRPAGTLPRGREGARETQRNAADHDTERVLDDEFPQQPDESGIRKP